VAGRFKRYFLRGLAVLLPTAVTIWIFVGGFLYFHEHVGGLIRRGLAKLLISFADSHEEGIREVLGDFWVGLALSVVSFLVVLVVISLVGAVLASVVGRALWRRVEKFIMSTPVLRRVYPYVKQITDFVLAQDELEGLRFSRVVAVEYPRKGIWSVGFVTGAGIEKVVNNVKKEFLTVLIPTSPTPFTGFVIMVPKKQTIELDMTVEEAFRFTISGGVITPGSKWAATALPRADSKYSLEG